MSKIGYSLLAGCFIVLFACGEVRGAYDPPHVVDNAVDCGNCHYTSGGTQPSWMSSGSGDNTVNNRRCLQCHTLYQTHSASATGSSLWQTMGGWMVECVDCHNPHYQLQSKRWGTASYLATGSVAAVGLWQTSANQTAVTLAMPLGAEYQGYYLIPNTAYRGFLYKIKTLTFGQAQVTVKGKIGTGAVFPKAGPGTSFAIVYARNIKDAVQYENPGGARVGSSSVRMFRPGGTRGPGDSAHPDESVCYVCHTLVSPAAAPGVTEHLEPSAVCTACHGHDEGFKPSCSACHAFPPLDLSGLVSSPLPTTGSTTAGAHARHATGGSNYSYVCSTCHTNGMPVTPITGNNRIQIGFNAFGTGSGNYDGQTLSNGYTYAATNGTTVTTGGSKTCSGIYCHGNYPGSGKNASPAWDSSGSGACGTCHGASNTTPPLSGQHDLHAGQAGRALPCTLCHSTIAGGTGPASYTVADRGRHVNGLVDYKFDPSDPRVAGGSYSIATGTLPPTDGVTIRGFGTCSTIYCHSNVQPDGGLGGPTRYTTVAWAYASWKDICGTCHDGGHGNLIATGSHTAHLAYNLAAAGSWKGYACAICHSWQPSRSVTETTDKCGVCHDTTNNVIPVQHANYQIDIAFDSFFNRSATYNGSSTPGTGYSDCSNTYCHGNYPGSGLNARPAWGSSGSSGCGTCHAVPPATGGHDWHANPSISTASVASPCTLCHQGIVAGPLGGPYTIADKIKHVNGYIDLQFDPGDARVAGPAAYSIPNGTAAPSDGTARAYGQCSMIYCHSDVQGPGGFGPPSKFDTPTWGPYSGSTSGKCGSLSCHGFGHGSFHPVTGAHQVHLRNGGSAHVCIACHTRDTSKSNMSCAYCHVAGRSYFAEGHGNGLVDVNFDPYYSDGAASYSGTPQPGDGYGSCSNNYCHSSATSVATGVVPANATPNWGTAGTLACNVCHGREVGNDSSGRPWYTNGLPKSNSHRSASHISITCDKCHYPVGSEGNNLSLWGTLSRLYHVNRIYDVAPGAGVSFTYVFSTIGGTCSGTSCHGVPATPRKWGGL